LPEVENKGPSSLVEKPEVDPYTGRINIQENSETYANGRSSVNKKVTIKLDL